ncbi:hypothetical protein [Flavobacterium wongokense]|uniref:hypothetical protein n=1 Tax=Flavobacterium wongokense TaxID=2910674 RepID=UPI001F2C401D|nr:hypothetical protein [Flavobacterium sp. WG47]MCF6132779.1 hypothetical protein [Flavobacterium sp. WG47]
MTQSYITYSSLPFMKLGLGTYYTGKAGFSLSANVQLTKKTKNFFISAIPRIDLKPNPAWDILLVIELRKELNANANWYFRSQSLGNFTGLNHNRSYQYLKFGIERLKTQFGIAADLDTYGPNANSIVNFGGFLRTVL